MLRRYGRNMAAVVVATDNVRIDTMDVVTNISNIGGVDC